MALRCLHAGDMIAVFDSPDGKTDDDYAVIAVQGAVQNFRVGSFEQGANSGSIYVDGVYKNGLDGKVSRVEFHDPSGG